MKKFAIIADTSADFDMALAQQYDIYLLSYYITMGETTYKDLVDINTRDFYRQMQDYEILRSAVPSPTDAKILIEKIIQDGYTDILVLTGSVDLTGMYNVLKLVESDYPNLHINIIDTRCIGLQTGLLVIYASLLRNRGLSIIEVSKEILKQQEEAKIFALFRTLKYIIRGGRLGKVKGTIGQLLKVQPLLCVDNGTIEIKESLRGAKKSLKRLAEITKENLPSDHSYFLGIFSGDNEEEIIQLKELLKDEVENASLFVQTELTSVLGVHGGPKAIGIAILSVHEELLS